MRSVLLLSAGALCAACAAPPQPPRPQGEPVPANDQRALEEIVRVAVAATQPQAPRLTATRGEALKDVLLRWTRQERVRLVYQTDFNPVLLGAVNEPDLRAAGIALSVLLQHEGQGALLDFNLPGVLVVRDHR